MKWMPEAEEALRKVPFFVRKKVRIRVEKEAAEAGKTIVSLADVKDTQQRYLSGMASEIRGYRVETCFGSGGCPNSVIDSSMLVRQVEAVFENADILGFLKSQVAEGLKFHHEFSVAIADCPNACSQPQIRDVGIIGALKPVITDKACIQCGACEETRLISKRTCRRLIIPDVCFADNASEPVLPKRLPKVRTASGYRSEENSDDILSLAENCPVFFLLTR